MRLGSPRVLHTAFVALALLAALPAFAEIGVNDEEILIGSCSSLEGQPRQGLPQSRGAQAYLDFVNKEQGGVYGRQLRLLAYNDSYDAEKAIECFNHILSDRVFMGAFFTGSATSAKYMQMAEANKVPILGFISGAEFLYDPVKRYVFPVRASFATEVSQVVDHLWGQAGARKIAVVYQYDAMGASQLDTLRQALQNRGATPAAVISMPVKDPDVEPIVRDLKASGAEVVMLCTTLIPAAAEIIKESWAAGFKPIFVNVGGRDLLAQQLGKAKVGNGTIITQILPSPDQTSLPAVKLFRGVMSKYAPKAEVDYYALEGFIDAAITVEALKRAGKDLTREALVDALEKMGGFDLGLGAEMKVAYSPHRHEAFDKIFFTTAENGKVVPFTDWKRLKIRRSAE